MQIEYEVLFSDELNNIKGDLLCPFLQDVK